jgi:hypothetical protein
MYSESGVLSSPGAGGRRDTRHQNRFSLSSLFVTRAVRLVDNMRLRFGLY